MTYATYRQLDAAVSAPMRNEMWPEALSVLDTGLETLPRPEYDQNYFVIMLIRSKLLALSSRFEESFQVISGLVDRGMPCGPWAFDRLPFGEEPRMIRLRQENDRLIEQLQQNAKMLYDVRLPAGYSAYKRYPLFMALHGDGYCNIGEFSADWLPEPFLQSGFILVYVQSSQVRCHDGYGWLVDPPTARRDVKACYDAVRTQYSVDPERVFIGGYSGGAIASLDITLSAGLPIRGFIALCPEIRPESFTASNVALAVERGVRGVFLEGDLVMPVPDEEEMARMLQEAGLPLLSEVNEGYGHEIPADFAAKVLAGLRFIDPR